MKSTVNKKINRLKHRILAAVLAVAMILSYVYIDNRRREAKADGDIIFTDDTFTSTGAFVETQRDISGLTDKAKYTVYVPLKNMQIKLPDLGEVIKDENTIADANWSVAPDTSGNSYIVTGDSVIVSIEYKVQQLDTDNNPVVDGEGNPVYDEYSIPYYNFVYSEGLASAPTGSNQTDGTYAITNDLSSYENGTDKIYYPVSYAAAGIADSESVAEGVIATDSVDKLSAADVNTLLAGDTSRSYAVYKIVDAKIAGEDKYYVVSAKKITYSAIKSVTVSVAGSDTTKTFVTTEDYKGITITDAALSDTETKISATFRGDKTFDLSTGSETVISGSTVTGLAATTFAYGSSRSADSGKTYNYTLSVPDFSESIDISVSYVDATPVKPQISGSITDNNSNVISVDADGKYYLNKSVSSISFFVAADAPASKGASLNEVKAYDVNDMTTSIASGVINSENTGATFTLNKSDLIEDGAASGEKTIVFNSRNSFDIKSVDSDAYSFFYDNAEPVFSDYSVNTGSISDTAVTGVSATKNLEISFKLSENESGLSGSPVISGFTGITDAGASVDYDSTTGIGKLTIPNTSANIGQTGVVTLQAYDKSNNRGEVSFNISYLDEKIDVTDCVIDSTKANGFIDGDFKLIYTIESDQPLVESTATLVSDEDPDIASKAKSTSFEQETIASGYKTTFTYEFDDYKDFVTLNNIQFNIKNVNGVLRAGYKLTILHIDAFDPTLSASIDTAQSTQNAGAGDWYQSIVLVVEVADNPTTENSGIAKLEISGVTKLDGTEKTDYVSEISSGKVYVKVKDSATKDGTTVVINAEDAIGHKANQIESVYYVDPTSPTINFDIVEAEGSSVSINGQTVGHEKDPYIVYKVYDKVYADYEVKIDFEKGGAVTENIQNDAESLNSVLENNPSVFGTNLSSWIQDAYKLNGYPVSGKYTLYINAKDLALNKATQKSISVIIDNTAPELGQVTFEQTNASFTSDTKSIKTADAVIDGKLTSNRAVSISMDLVEENFSEADSEISYTVDGVKTVVSTGKTYDSVGNKYSIAIPVETANTFKGKTVEFSFDMKDIYGNETVRKVTANFLEDKVEVEAKVTTTAVDEAQGIYKGHQDIVVEYTVTSDAPVNVADTTKFEFSIDGTASDQYVSAGTDGTDAANNKYVYKFKYTILDAPSQIVNNLKVSAENVNSASGYDAISVLKIDANGPSVGITKKSDGSVIDTAVWYEKLAVIVDTYDEATEYKSDIASIEMQGVKETNAEILQMFKNGSAIVVNVNPSTTSTGTPVSVKVADGVGWSNSASYTFYVDDQAPTSTLKIDGKDYTEYSSENVFIGKNDLNPEIVYGADDNINVGYTLKIKTPAGEEKTESSADKGTGFGFTKQLGVLTGGKPVDGRYEVTYTIYDNVNGRTIANNPKTARFILDNTKPVIEAVDVSQTGSETLTLTGSVYSGVTANNAIDVSFKAYDPKSSDGFASDINVAQSIVVNETFEGATKTIYTSENAGTKAFTIKADPSRAGKTVNYEIKVTDRVGNETTHNFTVKYLQGKIAVSHNTVPDKTRNGKFAILYKISSDAPIKDVNSANIVINNKSVSNIATDGVLTGGKVADNSYEYQFTYQINESDSTVLNNITFTVKDIYGNVSNKDVISVVNIDLRNPELIVDGGVDQTTWFSSKNLNIIYSESDKEYRSGIKTIKISGVKQAIGGQSTEFYTSDMDAYHGSILVDVNESTGLEGTVVEMLTEDQLGNRQNIYRYTFHVDEHAPATSFTVNGINYDEIDGSYIGGDIVNPVINYTAEDNIQLKNYRLTVTVPTGESFTVDSGENTNAISRNASLSDLIGSKYCNGSVPMDGRYSFTLTASDLAGTESSSGTITTSFVLDNTSPKNDIIILAEKPAKFDKFKNTYNNVTTGTNYEYGQYYNTDVPVKINIDDDNVARFEVADNSNIIYTGYSTDSVTLYISSEGEHNLTLDTIDKTGLHAVQATAGFTIDKTAPVITTTLNGNPYSNGTGMLYLNTNGSIFTAVSDSNKDTEDFSRTLKTTPPASGTVSNTEFVDEGSYELSQEADYEVSYVAVDRAGNRSEERVLTFRVDKTPPELKISGAAESGTSTTSVNVLYSMTESFFADMNSAEIKVYKKLDGQSETLLKTIDVKPNSIQYNTNELFSDDGEYRFEFTAQDKCGNSANTSYTFILDAKAPVITLSGVKNFDKTDSTVTLGIAIDETFFTSNKVTIRGTREDIDGNVEQLDFKDFNPNSAKVATFEKLFSEDGIYDISIESVDKAGNSSSEKLHFTIDTKAPEIGSLDKYADKKLSAFKWEEDFNTLIKDLTVCDASIYLDGVLYDGSSEVTDGSHVLRVTAKDELGHVTEKEVSFLLDSIAPNIIITNVEDGTVLKDPTEVVVSVQIDEDTLTSVTLNGSPVTINGNTATIKVDSKGSYRLTASAEDEAGNQSSVEINFSFGSAFPWWIIVIIGGLLLIMFLLFLLAKKKEKKKH